MSYLKKDAQTWLKEITAGIDACGDRSKCSDAMLKSLLKDAPQQAARNNGITDPKIIKRMEAEAWQRLESGIQLGDDLRKYFCISYALCYLDALLGANQITERMQEDIMDAILMDLGD
ncbi:MAG: hypothetical protein LR015_00595 [Verrucomicrobia bacterium]|nr:hypothetical protein [Verrucomicrobiota bacterium]